MPGIRNVKMDALRIPTREAVHLAASTSVGNVGDLALKSPHASGDKALSSALNGSHQCRGYARGGGAA